MILQLISTCFVEVVINSHARMSEDKDNSLQCVDNVRLIEQR